MEEKCVGLFAQSLKDIIKKHEGSEFQLQNSTNLSSESLKHPVISEGTDIVPSVSSNQIDSLSSMADEVKVSDSTAAVHFNTLDEFDSNGNESDVKLSPNAVDSPATNSTTSEVFEIPNPSIRGSVRISPLHWDDSAYMDIKIEKFKRLLDAPNVELNLLRETSWSGIPSQFRVCAWQMLLGYLPLNRDRQVASVQRKQAEYQQFKNQFGPLSAVSDNDQPLLRQVLFDVKRTSPSIPFFQSDQVQRALERVLFIFAKRHFATGYVQGLNDVAAAFFYVFLSPYSTLETSSLSNIPSSVLNNIEGDAYHCLCRLVEGIQESYIPSQPGIQRNVHTLRELVHRIDENLVNHLESNSIEFTTFAFRWMNCLLLREFPLPLSVRLWDTYLSESISSVKDGFSTFHVFVCAALLLRFKNELMGMKMQEMLPFLQQLPTKNWTIRDIDGLVAQAFVYKSSFEGSPSHLK